MSTATPTRINTTELARAIRQVDPSAVLVAERILRRVVSLDHQLTGIVLHVPHRKTYLIRRDELLEMVEPDELGLAPGESLPEKVLLIARPKSNNLVGLNAADALVKAWRLLFHIRVHQALEQSITRGDLTDADVRRRIAQLGQVEYDEIRLVLRQEHLLLPPVTDRGIYVEFVATYFELRLFAGTLLPRYFPTLEDREMIDEILAADLDAAKLYRETRPEGAPDPVFAVDEGDIEDADFDWAVEEYFPTKIVLGRYEKQLEKAIRANLVGNDVAAAIYRGRAANAAPSDIARETLELARQDIERLADRLQKALGLTDRKASAWRRGLRALMSRAPTGVWTYEARILYDLQNVCIDCEREVFKIDLLEWIRTTGERPIQRPLPSHREVLVSRHLQRAAKRLRRARISDRQRGRLEVLFDSAVHQAEQRLRDRFRGEINDVLQQVGLTPANVPELVAQRKLTEELLDRIVERGFLNIGDLRDALSRNNLKLPDRRDIIEVFQPDQLLRMDSQLSQSLDGVYRRGEFYLRWLQRITAVVYGTRTGRWCALNLTLPFGGSYVTLEFVQAIITKVAKWLSVGTVNLVTPTTVVVLGLCLLALIRSTTIRKQVAQTFWTSMRGVRLAMFDGPLRLFKSPFVRKIRESHSYRLVMRFLVRPLFYAGLSIPLLAMTWTGWETNWRSITLTYCVWTLLFSTRLGRSVEGIVSDLGTRAWNRFRMVVLAESIRFVIHFFRQVLETVERFLYTVDEVLRFRSGESPIKLVVKAVLGLVWNIVTYVVRFCITLLLEPQINPIKHFPVVTVSHKLLIPTLPVILMPVLEPFYGAQAGWIVGGIVFVTPGIFGFLAWELKENWRLYDANRSENLRSESVGAHGETMIRYVRPGFHSGTLPKLYKRLRRADRKAAKTGSWKASRKYREGLVEVEESIRRFVERQLIKLLDESSRWDAADVIVESIHVGSNSVRIELACRRLSDESLQIALQEQGGYLVASVIDTGWISSLSDAQLEVLINALAGFYKQAGVHLVHEQLVTALAPIAVAYDITDEGLTIWPDDSFTVAAVYDLSGGEILAPLSGAPAGTPTLRRSQLVFNETHIPWQRWVEVWQRDEQNQRPTRPLAGNLRLILEPSGSEDTRRHEVV